MVSCVCAYVLSDRSILNVESIAMHMCRQAGQDVQVLYKMDKTGAGQEIVAADLTQNRDSKFFGFTHQMFLEVTGLTPPVSLHVAYSQVT